MPLIKSAKKKQRKDAKRKKINKKREQRSTESVKKIRKNTDSKNFAELLRKAFSEIDKSAKKGIIHKNKANRLKSRVSKYLKKIVKK